MNLQREVLHVPLYGWLAGAGALLLSILYFAKHRGASTAATGTNPANATAPGDPSNIYSDYNIYNQPGAAAGSAQVTPAPQQRIRRAWFEQPPALPIYKGGLRTLQPVQSASGPGGLRTIQPVGTAVSQGVPMPAPSGLSPWRPVMNSDIFGPAADGTSPVSPVTAWDMTPTAAFTQA